jgi:Carboxypeptidase regulatory-like domain
MPAGLLRIVGVTFLLTSHAMAGEVRGFVSDTGANAVAESEVRLLSGVPRAAEYRTITLRDGSFRIENVRPGVYTIRAWRSGFREEVSPEFAVRGGDVVETHNMLLQLGGCDLPGTICDDFGLAPPEAPALRKGRLVLGRNCGVNLDEGLDNPICAEDRRVDLWFRAESDSRLELQPGQGAALAQFTSYRCKSGHFEKNSWLMNGRGPGTELCVQTSEGHHAFVYVEEEVSNSSYSVKLYYVTYQ